MEREKQRACREDNEKETKESLLMTLEEFKTYICGGLRRQNSRNPLRTSQWKILIFGYRDEKSEKGQDR